MAAGSIILQSWDGLIRYKHLQLHLKPSLKALTAVMVASFTSRAKIPLSRTGSHSEPAEKRLTVRSRNLRLRRIFDQVYVTITPLTATTITELERQIEGTRVIITHLGQQ